MAKITLTIEDCETDGRKAAQISWNTDDTTGLLHSDGTQAEQIAYDLLQLLAQAGDVKLPTVKRAPDDEVN